MLVLTYIESNMKSMRLHVHENGQEEGIQAVEKVEEAVLCLMLTSVGPLFPPFVSPVVGSIDP